LNFRFRNEVFKQNSVTIQFVEAAFVALKNKFLAEKSSMKRAGIIFLMSKIYFTDDMANMLKLRITNEEWIVFKEFIEKIKDKKEFEAFKIMFYHLFTENFFRFTMKNKVLALDFGTPDNEMETQVNSNNDVKFWSELRREVEVLEKSEVVDLIQLNAAREEAIEPFKKMFPETSPLSEALDEFETLKTAIKAPLEKPAPSRVSRKEVSQACRDFLKSSGAGSVLSQIEIEEIEWDSDMEDFEATSSKSVKKKKRRDTKRQNKTKQTRLQDTSTSESDSEREFKKMNRNLGYSTQNVMKGIGAANFSDKLKQCYGKVEKN
jgi:Small nuclear RNA activating complex (SNAPc), subunit 1